MYRIYCRRNENDVFKMNLGNSCIMWSRVDDTLDNFLYWMATENPDNYAIEKQIYKSLCSSDSLFNHFILNKKLKAKREEEEQKRIVKRQESERKQQEELEICCKEKGLFYYIGFDEVVLIKATENRARSVLGDAQKDNRQMESYVKFIEKYPEFRGAYIVKRGSMEDVLKEIR